MRGLAPVPSDVARLRFEFNVNGWPASVGFWLFVPGAAAASLDWANTVCGQAILDVVPYLMDLQHDGSSFSTCRLDLAGLSAVRSFAFTSGRWAGGEANAIALCLHHVDGRGRSSSAAVTHLPAVPDVFIEDGTRVSRLGWDSLSAAVVPLHEQLTFLPDPITGHVQVVTLHRVRAGAPLVPPEIGFVQGFNPSSRVTTLRRRMPKSPGISPG